jgi:DNA-binding transcriptional LysR family regulator
LKTLRRINRGENSVTAITDLDIFARVARTGNMSAAGREMGLSPAVVSKRVSLLEEELGARLFQRTTRQLTLTETGEGYYKRVLDILNLVEEAEDFVNRRNDKPRGVLKVTAPTTFSRKHLAPHLADFLAKFPEIELDFHLTDDYVDIISRGFDLAIRIGELQDSSLVQKKLAADHRVICASPAYLERVGVPKTLADLEAHNCLMAGAQEFWRLTGPEGEHQFRPKGNIRSNSAEFIREAMVSGLGVGLRSLWDVHEELQNGTLKAVLPAYQGVDSVAIYAVYPCRDFMPAKVNALIDHLAAIYSAARVFERVLDPAAESLASQAKSARSKPIAAAPRAADLADASRVPKAASR